jgi:hypothetical protein
MVVGTRKSYCQFQKRLLMEIIFKGLFRDVSVDCGAQYIMTARPNQDYLENISTMVVGTRKSYCQFQKRLLMEIIFKAPFRDVSVDCGAQYIMTARPNQDYLENIFSQIRSLGGLNPTAVDFKHKIEKAICSRSSVTPTPGTTSVKSDTNGVKLV